MLQFVHSLLLCTRRFRGREIVIVGYVLHKTKVGNTGRRYLSFGIMACSEDLPQQAGIAQTACHGLSLRRDGSNGDPDEIGEHYETTCHSLMICPTKDEKPL